MACSLINIQAYAAVQTPSNMSYDPGDVVYEYNPNVMEEFSDEEIEIFDAEFIDNTEASDRDVAEYIKDLFVMAVSEVMPMQDDEEDGPEEIIQAESPMMLLGSRNVESNIYKNTVVFDGTFNNTDCRLVIPYSDYSFVNIIDGKLLNVGHSSITGRILYNSEDLNSTDYETYSYILNPLYGSTSSVYSYGSFNYQRHYYLNTSSGYNRITYSDTYGDFNVIDTKIYYSDSERTTYAMYILIFVLGVMFIWMRRRL